MKHPDVAEAAVVGVTNEDLKELPRAFVVLKPDSATEPHMLKKFVDGKTKTFMQKSLSTFLSHLYSFRFSFVSSSFRFYSSCHSLPNHLHSIFTFLPFLILVIMLLCFIYYSLFSFSWHMDSDGENGISGKGVG